MKRWINNYADVILGASIATLENFWGLGWKENPRLFFQPNGIDLAEFEQEVDPAEIRKTLNLPQDCRIVLTVGRFVPHKNQKIIPEIAAEICSELSDVYFVLNGVGPLKENVENRVKELGLKNRFRFASGFPSLIPLWKSSDVFLFPSLMEGFGIVIIEAAAAGLPVIACNIPAITEAASACNNAILIDVNATVDQWAEAVKKALDSGKLKGKDYENFKRSFQYTTQNSLHNLLKIYNQIAGKK
jgi:glycosyltransferase EpsF